MTGHLEWGAYLGQGDGQRIFHSILIWNLKMNKQEEGNVKGAPCSQRGQPVWCPVTRRPERKDVAVASPQRSVLIERSYSERKHCKGQSSMQDNILEASVGRVREKYQDVEWDGRTNVKKEKWFQEIDRRDRRLLLPELPWGCVQWSKRGDREIPLF